MSKIADAFVELSAKGAQSVFAALSKLGDMLAVLAQKANAFANKFGNSFKSLKTAVVGATGNMSAAFNKFSQKLGMSVFNGVQKAKGGLSRMATQVKSALTSAAQATVQAFTNQMPNLTAKIAIAFYKAQMFATQAAQGAQAAFGNFTNWVVNNIPAAFQQAAQKAQQALSGIAGGASGMAGGALGALAGAAGPAGIAVAAAVVAAQQLGRIFSSVAGTISRALGTVVNGLLKIASTAFAVGRTALNALLWPLRKLYDTVFSFKGLLAALGVTLSTAMVGRYVAHWTADAEGAQVAFKVILGSAGKAVTMLKELQALADRTPLQLPEVRDAAKHLLAMGVSATQVTDTIRRLGDVSQGLGLDLNHVADIYGKVSQANRLTGEDMRRFRLNGIPIARELAIMLGKSTSEIEHMAHTGKLKFSDVEKVFRRMTDEGGMFFNLMKEKSQTLGGLFSTIQDSLRNLAVYFGEGMAPAVKNIERRVIEFLDNAKEKIWPVRNQFRLMASELADRLPRALKAITEAIPYVTEGIKTARAVMQALREAAAAVGKEIIAWIGGEDEAKSGVLGIIKYVRFLANEWKLLWELATTRVKAFALDFQSEMVVAFGKLVDLLIPIFQKIGEALGHVLRAALDSVIGASFAKFADFLDNNKALRTAIAFAAGVSGGEVTKSLRDASRVYGMGKNVELDQLRKMFDGLIPKQDTKKAQEEMRKFDELLARLNKHWQAFLKGEETAAQWEAARKRFEDAMKQGGEALADTSHDLGGALKKGKDGFNFHGAAEFHKAIQQGIKSSDVPQKQLAEQKQIKKAVQDQNALIREWMMRPAGGAIFAQ